MVQKFLEYSFHFYILEVFNSTPSFSLPKKNKNLIRKMICKRKILWFDLQNFA